MNKREIVVGFSGGLDSTALLLLLHQNSIVFKAIHFDHGLRSESAEDAKWCQNFCEERNIPIEIVSLSMISAKSVLLTIRALISSAEIVNIFDFLLINESIFD